MTDQKRKVLARKLAYEGFVKKYVIYRSPEEGFLVNLMRRVVVGERSEYLVGWDELENKATCCTCKDFMVNVLFGDLEACKHMLAVEIAEKEKTIEIFYITPEEYRVIRRYFYEIPT